MKPLSPLENTKAVSFHPTEKNFQKLCFLICFPPLHQVFLLSPNFFFLSTILLDIHTLVLLSLVFASHFAHILHLFFGLPRAGCWFRGVFDLLSFPSHCHASIHNKTIKHGLEVIPLTTRKRGSAWLTPWYFPTCTFCGRAIICWPLLCPVLFFDHSKNSRVVPSLQGKSIE